MRREETENTAPGGLTSHGERSTETQTGSTDHRAACSGENKGRMGPGCGPRGQEQGDRYQLTVAPSRQGGGQVLGLLEVEPLGLVGQMLEMVRGRGVMASLLNAEPEWVD